MYLFFAVFGFIFVSLFSIFTNYIYDIYSINKVTNFLKPRSNSIWSNVSGAILPIFIWAYIEMPILSENNLFLVSFIVCIFISCSIMYIIKYGFLLLNIKNNIINIIAILVSTFIGEALSYMLLSLGNISTRISFIPFVVISLLFVCYILLMLFPPKSLFFRGIMNNQDTYDKHKK